MTSFQVHNTLKRCGEEEPTAYCKVTYWHSARQAAVQAQTNRIRAYRIPRDYNTHWARLRGGPIGQLPQGA